MISRSRFPRIRLFIALGATLALLLVPGASPAQALTPPSLKLISIESDVTILRNKSYIPVPAAPSVYVASMNGDFEIHAERPDYDTPVSLEQWIDGGAQINPLPEEMADGFAGLKDFIHITVEDAGGASVLDQSQAFCPGNGQRERVDDSGPQVARFPSYGCGGNPFTIGSVWGIDRGWAIGATGEAGRDYYGYYGYGGYGIADGDPNFLAPDGMYTTHLSIPQNYIDAFGISPGDASINVNITVKTKKSCSYICTNVSMAHAMGAGAPPEERAPARLPIDLDPDPSTLPDLISLPAFAMRINHSKKNGHDYLRFGANVWNDGPADLVVEGFRQPGEAVMDAFQYFYDNGVAVGRAPTGTLMYDTRGDHQHWHFQQFANYALLDATQTNAYYSDKEAFCLVPTDPINLAGEGAEWFPYSIGFTTACGRRDSIWIRETLDAGWGDTYYQWVAGQSFDITNLPNGHYFIRVTANPGDLLYERNTGNNESLRELILRGRQGKRKVEMLPFDSIG